MAVKTNQYASPTTQDASRGPSSSIWADCPYEDFLQASGGGIGTMGYYFFEDFIEFPASLTSVTSGQTNAGSFLGTLGKWAIWSDRYGVLDFDPNLQGGVAALSTNNAASFVTTTNITMQGGAPSFGFISPATNNPFRNKMWFECSVAVGSITTAKRDCFIGLCDTGATAVNTATVTQATQGVINNTTNTLTTVPGLFGFHFRSTTNPTDVGVAYNVAGGTVQYPGTSSNLQTLSTNYGPAGGQALTVYSAANGKAAANVFIKLGFIFDPTPACPLANAPAAVTTNQTKGTTYSTRIRFFVNGQLASAFLIATDIQASTFPSTWLAPTISYMTRSATAPGDFYVDWIRVAQLGDF